jgi:hypothetical protein
MGSQARPEAGGAKSTLNRWRGQGVSRREFSFFRFGVGWVLGIQWTYRFSALEGRRSAVTVRGALRTRGLASYLSIDSSRSSGSKVRVQGPRRRFGFEAVERDAIFRTKYSHVSTGAEIARASTDLSRSTFHPDGVLLGYALKAHRRRS